MSTEASDPRLTSVNLLTLDPDLGIALEEGERRDAARVTRVPAIKLTAGERVTKDSLNDLSVVHGEILGFQVASGLIGADVLFANRMSRRLLGAADLLLFDGLEEASLPAEVVWTTILPSTIALIDERLLTLCQRWPRLLVGVFKRSAGHMRALAFQQAISQLPRVEDRLLAMLWVLADQYGTANRDGVRVTISLKHSDISMMIGAARPTVSLAFSELVERGDIVAYRDGWQLSRDSLKTFAPHEDPDALTSF